jgi:hypothetical protein
LIVALLVPQLLHSIFGVNTLLSTAHGDVRATAQFRVLAFAVRGRVAGGSIPIVKCSFVVVYQHLRSRREGDDLRGLLAGLPREQQKKAQMLAPTATSGRAATARLLVLAALLSGSAQDGDRARGADSASPRQRGSARRYGAPGSDREIAPRPRGGIRARNLSLA